MTNYSTSTKKLFDIHSSCKIFEQATKGWDFVFALTNLRFNCSPLQLLLSLGMQVIFYHIQEKPVLHESWKHGSRAMKSHRCQKRTDTVSCKSVSLSPNRTGPVRFFAGIETSSKISHRCDIRAIITEIGRVNASVRFSRGYCAVTAPLRMRNFTE